MTQINRKFTEQECVANGGHFWNYYSANDCIDPQTFKKDYSRGRKCVYYPSREPEYRGCPLCGRVEQHIVIDRWEKKDDTKNSSC